MKHTISIQKKFMVGFTSLILGCSFLSVAQELRDAHEESVRTLEELFVITASKKEEKIWEAPGVVTIITANDIQQFGGRNLAEVLARAPGVQKVFTVSVPRLTIRGGDAFLSNEHVLLLLDGRPVRTANGNYSLYSPLYSFPLERIKRIEIVRGPGSVLYGTNAFEGVINIITKKNYYQDRVSVSLGGGSFGTKTSSVFVEQTLTNLKISAGANYRDASGWSMDIISSAGESVSKNAFEDILGLSVLLQYKNFSLSAFSGRMKQPGYSEFLSPDNSAPPISFHSQVENVDLNTTHVFDDSWTMKTNFTYNSEYFVFHRESSIGLSFLSNEFLIETTTHKQINGKLDFLAGLLINNFRGKTSTVGGIAPYSEFFWAGYGQVNYRPNRFLKFTAGTQYNNPENSKSSFVPRFSVVTTFAPKTGLKILYGEAFRSPNILETQVDSPAQIGSNHLTSEKSSSIDLQFFSLRNYYQWALTFYRNQETDFIRSTPTEDGRLTYENTNGHLTFKGVEAELKVVPFKNWYFQLGATYGENKDSKGLKNITLAPSTTIKAGIGYDRSNFSAGLFHTFSSAFGKLDNPSTNKESKESHLLTLNITLENRSLLGHGYNYSLSLFGSNLLDEELFLPEIMFRRINTVDAVGGRAFFASFKLQY